MHLLFYLLKHKFFLLISGFRVGNIPIWNLLIHDWSKLTPSQFYGYSRQYYGDKKDPLAFKYAWLDHMNREKHHPEHWIMRSDKFSLEVNVVLPMPEVYVREMVADWLAASKVITGNWDISTWLENNYSKMILHPETSKSLKKILDDLQIPNKF